MATNLYFQQDIRSEAQLYEDIIIESLRLYGQDIYYLPRDIINEDKIFGEDVPSRFNSSYKIEMYIENIEGFDGEGDLFTRFGVEIRDAATFIVSKRRWNNILRRYDNEITAVRPIEGDLLYIPFSRKLFQIMHVEHEQPFYQLQNLPIYKLRCELFEYNDEDFDTGTEAIDNIESKYAYTYMLSLDSSVGDFVIGENVTQTIADGVIMTGEVSSWNDSSERLGLIHIGADDGLYHNFITNTIITGSTSSSTGIVTLVQEEDLIKSDISEKEDNTYYDTLVDFLDFSESNPFGDPS